ncbi:hypothetical protein MAR_013169 [Mya arenaria]|uniref:Uncharacterized protein n=1 Tax=Mya arenaria TaxID=6604 RepID=A0ABY7FZR9_MYAAR|nr:uncharacterized protein LOC128220777 [Mya arenaria]WAR27465.1 hypothetical protein MAR_013169 [Mya arenaria]
MPKTRKYMYNVEQTHNETKVQDGAQNKAFQSEATEVTSHTDTADRNTGQLGASVDAQNAVPDNALDLDYLDEGKENLRKRFGDFEFTKEDRYKLAFLILFPVTCFLIAVVVTSQYV